MGKQRAERRLADNEARAMGHMIRISSRKLNLVAQTIRGATVGAALNRLAFSSRRCATIGDEVPTRCTRLHFGHASRWYTVYGPYIAEKKSNTCTALRAPRTPSTLIHSASKKSLTAIH